MNDLTIRKQAEEEVRKSEARFQGYFSLTLHGIAITSPDKGWIEVNDRICSILGYSRDELFRMNWKELTHPDDLAADIEQFNRILCGQIEQYTMDKRFIRKDGGVIWTNINIGCVRKSNGSVDYILGLMEDISERKLMEESLKKTVQVLNDTGKMAKVGGWELDLLTQEVSWMGEVYRIHGVEPGNKIMLEEALNFYAPEYRPALEEALKKTAETGEPFDLESLFIPSGSKDKIWVRSLGKAVYQDGKIVKLVGTFQDIDKSKQVEEALQESDNIFQQFLKNSPNYVFFKNDKMQAIRLSSNYEKMLGKPMHELLGKTTDDLFPSDLAKSMLADDLLILNEGKQIKVEEELNGRFYSTIKFPILVEGKPRYLAGYTTDITERKETENKLLYRIELEKLIAAISTRFVGIPLDKIDNEINRMLQIIGQFSHIDRSYLFLFSGDGSIMDNTHEWCAPGIEAQIEHLQGFPSSTFPWWMEKLNRNEIVYIPRVDDLPTQARAEKEILQSQNIKSVLVVPITYELRLVGFIGFDAVQMEKSWTEEDITLLRTLSNIIAQAKERKLAEERLQRFSEELELKVEERTKELKEAQDQLIQSANLSLIGELASGVAHEVRNPLASISLIAQDLENKSADKYQIEKLKIIQRNINRIDKITANLLNLSHPACSDFSYHDINEILDRSGTILDNITSENMKIIKKYETNLPRVWLSPDLLEQVFSNLIFNAMRAMKKGGDLYITTSFDSTRKGIIIKFKDTGIGISEENIKKIFKPFFTISDEGTGLGLSICQNIINEHKGNISVESKLGKGTIFTIFLPLEKRKEINPGLRT